MSPIDALTATQREIEQAAVMAGTARFRTACLKATEQGRPEEGTSVTRLLRETLRPVSEVLAGVLADAASGRPGRHHAAVAYLAHLSPDQAAFVTGRALFHELLSHSGKRRLQRVALSIGRAVVTEALASDFQQTQPKAYDRAYTVASRSSSGRRAKTVMIFLAHKNGVAEQPWPEQTVYSVGMALLDAFMVGTGLVEIRDTPQAGTIGYISEVVLTPKAADWLARSDAFLEVARPVQTPMVCLPRDWNGPYDGGYLLQEMRIGCAIHSHVRPYVSRLRDNWDTFKRHFEAVNILQKVPWRINPHVLAVAQAAWQTGGNLTDCLPPLTREPLPPRPPDINEDTAHIVEKLNYSEAHRKWKKAAHAVYDRECTRMANAATAGMMLKQAERFYEYDRFYFTYYADFRGRLYTHMTDLTPQGRDLAKGLLDFADGLPINTGLDAFWLAVAGANHYGIDKVCFDDRVSWVEAHWGDIETVASDPLGETAKAFWLGADKPWQFLAWCFDWVGFKEHGKGYVSHARVDLDGSCNGLQHFAALMGDKVTGAAVNLVPSDTPNDLYQQIADQLVAKLKLFVEPQTESDYVPLGGPEKGILTEEQQQFARKWIAWGIDRKMTKRPVMVLPYGGTISSTRKYLRDTYLEAIRKRTRPDYWPDHDGPEFSRAVGFLAAALWQVLADALPAALNTMRWLQRAASACSKAKRPIVWRSPTGFLIEQAYPEMELYRVALFTPAVIYKSPKKRDLTLAGPVEGDALSARQQRQGIAPNFVHSLDAAHLVSLAIAARDAGITSIAVNHDSYGCRAAEVDPFFRLIRSTLVDLYDGTDWLESFRSQVSVGLKAPVEPATRVGTLDVRGILESDYAFA